MSYEAKNLFALLSGIVAVSLVLAVIVTALTVKPLTKRPGARTQAPVTQVRQPSRPDVMKQTFSINPDLMRQTFTIVGGKKK